MKSTKKFPSTGEQTTGASRHDSDYRGIKSEEIAQSKTRNQNRLCVLALASLVILLIFVVFTCLAVAFVEISNLKSEIAHLPSGPAVHGVIYTRWGKSTCRSEVNHVYAGRTGSSFYLHQGGGANYICMPNDPEYSSYIPGVQGHSFVYGTEYEGPPLAPGMIQHNAPCAVCNVSNKSRVLMIPAKLTCPMQWLDKRVLWLSHG